MKIKILQLSHGKHLPLPRPATLDSAGSDLYAAISSAQVIFPFSNKLIPTGISIELPRGYEAQIRPRSGLAYKFNVTVLNSPGTIDSDYRGEIFVMLINLGKEDFTVNPDMRIAQMVISKYENIDWVVEDKLNNTDRGHGGFGSSGY